MVTIQQRWPWSFALLFIIRVERSSSSPSISRLNGAVADPLAELKLSSCSQQLEKLKTETRRHVSALNAITDNSMSAGWRNRRLLSTIQTTEAKLKSKSNTLLSPGAVVDSPVRIPVDTEDMKNPFVKYLSSLDHTGWVKKCLDGGKCSIANLPNEETEMRASEPLERTRNRTNASKSSTKIYNQNSTSENHFTVGEINKLANETLVTNTSPQPDEIVSGHISKLNSTEGNRIIDLLPRSFEPLNDTGSDITRSRVEEGLMIDHQNYTSLSNQSVRDQDLNISGVVNGKSRIQVDTPESPTKTIDYSEDSMARKIQSQQNGSVSFSSSISNDYESSSSSTANDFVVSEGQIPHIINSLRHLPNTNRLVNFPPLTIQFTPMTFYQRYPRSGKTGTASENDVITTSRGIEKTLFVPNSEVERPNFGNPLQEFLHDSQGRVVTDEMGSLDNLVANYGNDIFKRGSTGKRESGFSNPKKEAVTANYPEVPGLYNSADTAADHIFTMEAPVENGSDSNIYFFVGGNWVANFKDNPRLFYIQPQTRQSVRPPPFTGVMENGFGSAQPSLRPYSSANTNCASDKILAPPKELHVPSPYSQPSYAVDESNSERYIVPSIDNARAANPIKNPSRVAARNGYEWYNYDIARNDVYTGPMNGPFSGGPVAYPNAVESRNIPYENRRGVFRQKTDRLNYEDSLVNFPPPKYEPPLVGSSDASIVKPEEFMEHDINTSDMFVLGTQLLAALPLVPSEQDAKYANDGPSYGQLVADVSSRSSPGMKSNLPKNPPFTAFNTAFKTLELVNSPEARPGTQVPSTYFSASRPNNDFEFVSGQWVKRKPVSVMSSGNGQVGQRRIRDLVVKWPGISTFKHVQPLSPPFKSKCFS